MPGVPRNLIEHLLNVDPKATPKRQHLCRFADDRRDTIKKELAKLLVAGFIRDVSVSHILSGSPTPSSSARRKQTSGGCASTTPISKSTTQGPLRATADRSSRGFQGGLRPTLLPRLLLWVPPDRYQGRRPVEDRVHHPVRCLLLHNNVVRVEERRCYVPTSYPDLF
jgi:hypothetical protein